MRLRWLRRLRHHGSGSAPRVEEHPAPAEPVLRPRTPGEPYVNLGGLHVTVSAIEQDATRAAEGTYLVLLARVENPTAARVEFDNDFGVVDGRGAAHPRGYADPRSGRTALPSNLTLEPATALEGAVYVHMERGAPPPFRPAYLTTVERGCSSCLGGPGVDLIPLALWQATAE